MTENTEMGEGKRMRKKKRDIPEIAGAGPPILPPPPAAGAGAGVVGAVGWALGISLDEGESMRRESYEV